MIAGGVYLAAIFLGSAGSSIPRRVLPRPVRYLTQVACLFPHAAEYSIEYRAAGYSCRERQFREIDHRPYFPVHRFDKESRFHRVAYFHRRNRQVMRTLENYLIERHNRRVARGDDPDDGIDGAIGGIYLMSLRIPFPEPGSPVERYVRPVYADVPPELRKLWYITPPERRRARCEETR